MDGGDCRTVICNDSVLWLYSCNFFFNLDFQPKEGEKSDAESAHQHRERTVTIPEHAATSDPTREWSRGAELFHRE